MSEASLPKGWVATTLGSVRVDGSTRVVPNDTPGRVFELFSIPSFPTGRAEVIRGAAVGSDKQSVVPGTVLVSKINPRINRVWTVRPQTDHPVIASTEWVPFFPMGAVDPLYLTYYLRRDDFREYLATNVSGVGGSLMRVRPVVMERYPLPLPPLAEQRRIVAALEEHLSDLDAAVAGLERARANVKRYTQAVITDAVAERSEWPLSPLRELGTLKGGITKGQKRRADEPTRPVPYLRVANVQRGRLDLTDVRCIDATKAEIAELRLEAGDVLFNEGGDRDKLGRGWVWDAQLPECIHQNHVFRARLDRSRTEPRFVSYYANTIGQRYFVEQGRQTTNLASINMTKLGALPVPVPPLREQQVIVAEVERRLTVADRAAADIDVQLARASRLRQAILRRAFEGRLVPQDPADEPAAALLARIRAEQGKRPARTGRRRITA